MLIKPITATDNEQWASLLATCFERSHEQMRRLLDWLPRLCEMVAWGVWDGDRLIAQYTCLLRPISNGQATLMAGMSINMAVHPDYRGRGLVKLVARPVYDEVRARGGALGLGFSNARGVRVDRQSAGYGYHVVGQMQSVLIRLPFASVSELLIQDTFPQQTFIHMDWPSDRWHFVKSPDYFAVRYGQHPFRRYRYGVSIEQDCVVGLVVFRDIRLAHLRGAALLDAYGSDLPDLLACWSQAMRAQGASFAQLLVAPRSSIREAFPGLAFRAPMTRSPHYLTLKPLAEDLPVALDRFECWDFVGGDVL